MDNAQLTAALRRGKPADEHGLLVTISRRVVETAARIIERLPEDGEPTLRVDVTNTVKQAAIADRLVAMGWARPMQTLMLRQGLTAIAAGAMPNASELAASHDWLTFSTHLQRIAREALAATDEGSPDGA